MSEVTRVSCAEPGTEGRAAVGLASDDPDALARVAVLVDDLGFDPVVACGQRQGRVLEPGGPVFGHVLTADELRPLLQAGSLSGR